jgi:hypothetical protein
MKKKALLLCAFFVVLIAGYYFLIDTLVMKEEKIPPNWSVDLVFIAEDLDDLILESDFIVTGEVSGKNTKINYGHMDFANSEIAINSVLRGDSLKQKETLNVLQTPGTQPPFTKGDEVLLFLHKYKGAIIEDAYVCVGLFQGHFNIINKHIVPSKNYDLKLNYEIEELDSIEDLAKRIEKVGKRECNK